MDEDRLEEECQFCFNDLIDSLLKRKRGSRRKYPPPLHGKTNRPSIKLLTGNCQNPSERRMAMPLFFRLTNRPCHIGHDGRTNYSWSHIGIRSFQPAVSTVSSMANLGTRNPSTLSPIISSNSILRSRKSCSNASGSSRLGNWWKHPWDPTS
jgi:hypothetical protein